MRKHPIILGQIIIWALFTIGLTIVNGGSVIGNNPPASRWARVDLTEYCDKTIGELLDSLGNDYNDFWGTRTFGALDGFAFRYGDAILEVDPTMFIYCSRKSSMAELRMEDIRKERIGEMILYIGKK